MARLKIAFASLALAVLAAACSGKKDGGTVNPPGCVAQHGQCGIGTTCCSPYSCDGATSTCEAPTCVSQGGTCSSTGGLPCCTPNDCVSGKCEVVPPCLASGSSCTAGGASCCGVCNAGTCEDPQCIPDGQACGAAGCCSTICDTATNTCKHGGCAYVNDECSPSDPSACCSGTCVADASSTLGGKCAKKECISSLNLDGTPSTTACTSDSECCSQICSGTATSSGTCQPVVGAGSTCHTLYEACATGIQCCSWNCKDNRCFPAYPGCNAYGDVCTKPTDCCSGLCSATGGAPGRCIDPSGGCIQDGNPCAGGSNCCTKTCEDPGTGVTVCKKADGCKMTGDYCDSNQACCGGSPDDIRPAGYKVFCDTAANVPPDTSKTNDYRCTNGTSCNPPGNICGGSGAVPASQNCCDGKKAVCKQDSAGIYRCFGGCPNDVCPVDCPTGYDYRLPPPCCIDQGHVCDFTDQCCNGAQCVQDPNDQIFKCTAACLALGKPCTAGDTSCCSGTTCALSVEPSGYYCLPATPPPTCVKHAGDACTTSGECCTGYCNPATSTCQVPRCTDTGNACSQAYECCTGICNGSTCVSCLPEGSSCSVDKNCCAGTTCEIPSGAVSGTCKAPITPPTCAKLLGESCTSTYPCCDTTNYVCGASGTCETKPPTCQGLSAACTTSSTGGTTQGNCCAGYDCYDLTDSGRVDCTAGVTTCYCDTPTTCVQPTPTAPAPGCSTSQPCCTTSAPYYCATNGTTTPLPDCTSSSSSSCHCAFHCVQPTVATPHPACSALPDQQCCSGYYCALNGSAASCNSTNTADCSCWQPG